MGETETLGGAPRAGIARIALPLQAAVAEPVEGLTGQQEYCLAGARRALQGGTEGDVADLDATVLRGDAQVGEQAEGTLAALVDHCIALRITALGMAVQPGVEGCAFGEGAVGQVIPQRRIRAL